MAGSAMSEAFYQIGASVPLGAFRRIVNGRRFIEEEPLPQREQGTKAERKNQLVMRCPRLHGLTRHQERVNCGEIIFIYLIEMLVWKYRIEMSAPAVDARAHGAKKG